MKRTIILSICLGGLLMHSYAQQLAQYRYADATQLWRLTNNAAGLSLDSTTARGYALFNAEHWEGDYTRIQEGKQKNQLHFDTERYQTIGKYLHTYGRFRFDYGRTKERAWADVMRPYNSNPFFAGSSISGKYDFQDFDFSAAIGTIGFGGWHFGLRLDYKVGDLSRLRDPRSRSQLLDYKLSPAIVYTTGQHAFGLSGNYHRRKEKIIGVTTVQQDPTLKYYQMYGMEQAEGTIGGYSSFGREWVDHRFGGELTYAFRQQRLHSLLVLSIERGEENAYGQYKFEPGLFVDYRYGISLRNRIQTGSLLHELDLQAGYDQAYADEYRQQLNQEKDAETGYTSYSYSNLLVFKKRYQVKQTEATVRYRLGRMAKNNQETTVQHKAMTSYAGAAVSLNDTKNKHLLPASDQHYNSYQFMVEGGYTFGQLPFGKPQQPHSLTLEAQGIYHLSKEASLNLADATTDYATGVLLPDLPYYQANYWQAHLQLTYEFPLKIKNKNTHWFVRAYGDYLKTDNQLHASCVGLSIGLFN